MRKTKEEILHKFSDRDISDLKMNDAYVPERSAFEAMESYASQEREGIEQLIVKYETKSCDPLEPVNNKYRYRTFISELEKLLKPEL